MEPNSVNVTLVPVIMKRRFQDDDCAESTCTKNTKNDLIKDTPRRCGLKALARKYELIHKADHATENELDISLPGLSLPSGQVGRSGRLRTAREH